jgi:hypothetical protein
MDERCDNLDRKLPNQFLDCQIQADSVLRWPMLSELRQYPNEHQLQRLPKVVFNFA